MKRKRNVSSNLGRTQHRLADEIYKSISNRIGLYKRCPFYNGNKYSHLKSDSHNILNPNFQNPNVPVEEYDFQFDKKKDRWDLQSYCKVCFKAYRDVRINLSRSRWSREGSVEMTDSEIRRWYIKNVGLTMRCSSCLIEKTPREFSISKSMEKGLHNICKQCSAASGTSVREQIWLSDGDWNSWKDAVTKMRLENAVTCVGWPRAVEAKKCMITVSGKLMHADHKVPLRAGGIHDRRNFQPLCGPCNVKKSDQIDPRLSNKEVEGLVGARFKSIIKNSDSIGTVERKLKAALISFVSGSIKEGSYFQALKNKKKEVNGQWSVSRALAKANEWLKKGESVIQE